MGRYTLYGSQAQAAAQTDHSQPYSKDFLTTLNQFTSQFAELRLHYDNLCQLAISGNTPANNKSHIFSTTFIQFMDQNLKAYQAFAPPYSDPNAAVNGKKFCEDYKAMRAQISDADLQTLFALREPLKKNSEVAGKIAGVLGGTTGLTALVWLFSGPLGGVVTLGTCAYLAYTRRYQIIDHSSDSKSIITNLDMIADSFKKLSEDEIN